METMFFLSFYVVIGYYNKSGKQRFYKPVTISSLMIKYYPRLRGYTLEGKKTDLLTGTGKAMYEVIPCFYADALPSIFSDDKALSLADITTRFKQLTEVSTINESQMEKFIQIYNYSNNPKNSPPLIEVRPKVYHLNIEWLLEYKLISSIFNIRSVSPQERIH